MAVMEFRISLDTTVFGPSKVRRTEFFIEGKLTQVYIDELKISLSPDDALRYYDKIIASLVAEKYWKIVDTNPIGAIRHTSFRVDDLAPWSKLWEKFLND